MVNQLTRNLRETRKPILESQLLQNSQKANVLGSIPRNLNAIWPWQDIKVVNET
jgi:hypothetical protein